MFFLTFSVDTFSYRGYLLKIIGKTSPKRFQVVFITFIYKCFENISHTYSNISQKCFRNISQKGMENISEKHYSFILCGHLFLQVVNISAYVLETFKTYILLTMILHNVVGMFCQYWNNYLYIVLKILQRYSQIITIQRYRNVAASYCRNIFSSHYQNLPTVFQNSWQGLKLRNKKRQTMETKGIPLVMQCGSIQCMKCHIQSCDQIWPASQAYSLIPAKTHPIIRTS